MQDKQNKPLQSELLAIPGIGRTFAHDFRRLGITTFSQLAKSDPELLFKQLCERNASENHKTSKNYLYVIRMAVYYAQGGREPEKLRWSSWKDK